MDAPAEAIPTPLDASEPLPSLDVAEMPASATETPLVGDAEEQTGARAFVGVMLPPAPPAAPPRYRARVTIFAGRRGPFAPGDEIPEAVAIDGLAEGEHFTREG